jgi:hypothetical protein
MTKIKYREKPVWHETSWIDGATGRVMLVAETHHSLLVRLKGTRQVLSLPWGVVFIRAAWAEASRVAREKKKLRDERRKNRSASAT